MDENDESRLTENGVSIKKEPSPAPQSRSGSEKEDSIDKDDSSDVKEKDAVKEEMEDSYPDKESVEKEAEVEEQETAEKAPDEGIASALLAVTCACLLSCYEIGICVFSLMKVKSKS